MSGSREVYRISSLNPNEINRLLDRIGDRLDAMEGRRGLPNMFATLDMNLNKIIEVLDPTNPNDAAVLDTFQTILLTGLDATLGTLEADTLEVNTTSTFEGDSTYNGGFLEVRDPTNGDVIHAFGEI